MISILQDITAFMTFFLLWKLFKYRKEHRKDITDYLSGFKLLTHELQVLSKEDKKINQEILKVLNEIKDRK